MVSWVPSLKSGWRGRQAQCPGRVLARRIGPGLHYAWLCASKTANRLDSGVSPLDFSLSIRKDVVRVSVRLRKPQPTRAATLKHPMARRQVVALDISKRPPLPANMTRSGQQYDGSRPCLCMQTRRSCDGITAATSKN